MFYFSNKNPNMAKLIKGRLVEARTLEWVVFLFSRGSYQPRIEPRSPALQADSLPAELPGKPIDMYISF